MPSGRKNNFIGQVPVRRKRDRLRWQNETEEHKAERKLKAKIYYCNRKQNETEEERERRLATARRRGAIYREGKRSKERRLARELAISEQKLKPRRPHKSGVLKEGVKDMGIICAEGGQLVAGQLEPEVKVEPSFELADAKSVQELIEVSNEIKQEYSIESFLVEAGATRSRQQQSRTVASQDEKSNKFGDISPFTKSVDSLKEPTMSTSGFSRGTPIQSKDEALKYVKMLEGFALQTENVRLIGFSERLQHLIREAP